MELRRRAGIYSPPCVLILLISSHVGAVAFEDDFSGSSLDLNKWKVLSGENYITIENGKLKMDDGVHKRIVSKDSFTYGFLEGDFTFGGDYQKFGFGVNASEFGYSNGFFFDTMTNQRLSARIYNSGSCNVIYQSNDDIIGNTLHLGIYWGPDAVKFYRDGTIVASYALSFDDLLPIGIFDDRSPVLYGDNVRLSAIPEPTTLMLVAIGMIGFLIRGKKNF